MAPTTYLQHVQNVLSILVRDGDTRINYERMMIKVHTRKRWDGEEPVLHHRRLIHTAIMREVWAKRVRVTGKNEGRVITVTDYGVPFYLVWKKPERQPGGKSGRAALGRNRAELMVEYVRTATLLSSLRELLADFAEGSHWDVRNLPDLVRDVLQTETYKLQQNIDLSQQVLDGSLRIKSLENELRRRGTAVTTSDVAAELVDR
ncbi:hypothetical protein C8T65DRAFT_741733 [Cerioporus squamosus]|nr:hypothetical protein C8T65DRAFT_741733 [Cerioporus squamosus]